MQRNKILVLAGLISGATLLANCSPKAGKSVAATPAPTTTENPHYSATQLAEGKAIYTANCGKCHKLFTPESKSVEKWEKVLPPMIKKAKLDETRGLLVRAYVMANLK